MTEPLSAAHQRRVEEALVTIRDEMGLRPCVAVGDCRCPTHRLVSAARAALLATVAEIVREAVGAERADAERWRYVRDRMFSVLDYSLGRTRLRADGEWTFPAGEYLGVDACVDRIRAAERAAHGLPSRKHPECVATMCGVSECSGGSHPCYVAARHHTSAEGRDA